MIIAFTLDASEPSIEVRRLGRRGLPGSGNGTLASYGMQLSVHVYACMYVCMCMYVCVCIYIYIDIYIYIYI